MSLQEIGYDPALIDGMRKEWGLPPETLGVLDTVDLKSGKNDVFLLGALESDALSTQTKVETVSRLFDAIFDSDEIDQYDQNRVGRFLQTATKLYEDKNVPDQLRQELYNRITPVLLADLAMESSVYRWTADNTEGTLNAYCSFQTIERKYKGEEATIIYRKIAKELVSARQFDITLERAEGIVSSQRRGTVIYLGARGAEVAQTVAKHAFRTTCQENYARPVIAPYYRDHVLTTNLGENFENPQGDLLSLDEAIANLCRIEGGTRAAGVELNMASKTNTDGKISIFPATPNVGGHILAASGHADRLRLYAIRKEGIFYEKPQRAHAYRDIQIDNTKAAVLISLGDGAYQELDSALEHQASNRTPVINLIQNNRVAIGVELDEVVAQDKLYQKGHGKEVPGIRIDETDIDGLYFAVQFATQRALLDAGPTIVEAMTRRLLPHSNAHGDHLTSEYIQQVMRLLENSIQTMPQDDSRKQAIKNFITTGLIRPNQSDNQIKLKERLRAFLTLDLFDEQTRQKIANISNNIIDPVQASLDYLQQKGYTTEGEVDTWGKEAKEKMETTLQQVLTQPQPKPEDATLNIRLETPRIEKAEYSHETVNLNISEAIQRAIQEAMKINRNILVMGPDVYKGSSIRQERGKIIEIDQGGYFNQTNNLFMEFGPDPRRMHNTPVAEQDVLKYALGMSTTPTDPEALKNALRILIDFQYADYGIEAFPAWHVLSHILYTTGGKITRPAGVLLPSGAVAGGGPMHSHEVAAKALQTPSSVDIFYTSDPETTYKLLLYCMLYENNPYIFMVDKTRIFQKEEFEIGTGFFEPGKAKVRKPGNGIQFIAYGPMVNKVNAASAQLNNLRLQDSIGILDVVSLRPFPKQDTVKYLEHGTGPIVIAHEEPQFQGFGNQIVSMLARKDSEFHDVVKNRDIYLIGSKDVPVPPCDGILMNAVIPTAQGIRDFIAGLPFEV